MPYLNLNGQILDSTQPLLHATNRAFRYGDGVFETIRVAMGKVLFLSEHFHRLQLSLYLLGIEGPMHITALWMKREIECVLEANNLDNARIRFSVFRADGGYYQPETDHAAWLVEAGPLESPWYTLNETGLSMGIYRDHFKPYSQLAGLKSANSLPYVLAARWAAAEGLDDALVMNEHGRIAEASASNILVLKDGQLITPSATEACVSGTMREIVIALANRMNIDTKPGTLTEEDLATAQEIWLTNAVQGIRWVGWMGDQYYHNTVAQQIHKALVQRAQQIAGKAV